MENEVRLLKTDRNSVLLLIQEAHLDPSEFQWQGVTASITPKDIDEDFLMSRLIHMPTYQFDPYNDRYSPGLQNRLMAGESLWSCEG